jgi:DNA topoisomerase IA
VPNPYWIIRLKFAIDGSVFEAEYEKKIIETKAEADALINICKGNDAKIEKIVTERVAKGPSGTF